MNAITTIASCIAGAAMSALCIWSILLSTAPTLSPTGAAHG